MRPYHQDVVTCLLIKYAEKVISSASEAGTLPFPHTAKVQKFYEFLDFAAGRYSIRKIRNSKVKQETGGRNCAAGHPLRSCAVSPGIPQHDKDKHNQNVYVDNIRDEKTYPSREERPKRQPVDRSIREEVKLHQYGQGEGHQNKSHADSHLLLLCN